MNRNWAYSYWIITFPDTSKLPLFSSLNFCYSELYFGRMYICGTCNFLFFSEILQKIAFSVISCRGRIFSSSPRFCCGYIIIQEDLLTLLLMTATVFLNFLDLNLVLNRGDHGQCTKMLFNLYFFLPCFPVCWTIRILQASLFESPWHCSSVLLSSWLCFLSVLWQFCVFMFAYHIELQSQI